MGLETGTYIDALVATNPSGASDPKSQGDNHLRLLKSVLKATFPNADRAFRFAATPAAKTSAYTILASDENALIQGDASGGAFTITLPLGSAVFEGFKVSVMKSDSGANVLTLDGNGSEQINGGDDVDLSKQYQGVTVEWDGSEWKVIASPLATVTGTAEGDAPALDSDAVVPSELGGTPIGAGMDFWGTTAPTGWLFCYGQAVSRTTYSKLFAKIGTAHGVGDGSTTFNLPDKRGRASFGKDDMGGSSADRLTDQSGGIDGDTLGDTGGAETHQLVTSEMPAHTHSISGGGDIGQTSSPPGSTWNNSGSETTGSRGGDGAHNNLPPGIVCNYIIFAGA